MQIYLPIAELSVNMFTIFGMGAAVGLVSGLFGVGGGFLLTPLLIFTGIPPAVAVGTVTSQIVASSASGALSYWRRQLIDWKLAGYLCVSGILGAAIGAVAFQWLRRVGQLDLFIGISYVLFLGFIGALMVWESMRAILGDKFGWQPPPVKPPMSHKLANWPLKVRFHRSRLYISALPIAALGVFIGFMGTLLGIGGGFIMVPALIYLFNVPTNVVIGTSLVQILFTMSAATIFQSGLNSTVDIVLALILMIGGVIGAQFGARIGQKLKGEQLRALLGFLILAVGIRFLYDLAVYPTDLFSLAPALGSK
ncbi:MAG: sulfite exporter TauE/SafE family protein [Hyphomicrobiaceae bacterium]|nr:sulfite exporter TauE/SafE family protein [Hyphomicrobiaceae bacterium]